MGKKYSNILDELNGVSLRNNPEPLQVPLESVTNMPFAPNSYRVSRNYKRVFECSFLTTSVENRLTCTDFCNELADPNGNFQDVDDYLSSFARST